LLLLERSLVATGLGWTVSIRMAGVLSHERMLPVSWLSLGVFVHLIAFMAKAVGMWAKAARL